MTKNTVNVKLDSEGKPFKFKAVQLPKKEYAEVMSEIGRWWHTKYDGVEFCRMDFTDKLISLKTEASEITTFTT